MKKEIIVSALIAILFVLVAGSILASFTFYKEYKDKIDYLEQQSMSGKTRLEGVEAKVDSFKAAIDDMTNQVKTSSDTLKLLQNTVTLSDEERKALLTKLEEMKTDLQSWQKDYSSAIIDMKQSMVMLKDEIDGTRKKSREVELGKITVKQEEGKAEAQAAKNTAGSTGVKPGTVRKVGAY